MSDPLHRFLSCGRVHVEYSEIELPRRRLLLPAALLRVASDARLVSELRAGSERAFEVLFDRHYVPLLAYCRHLLGSVDEGEDAVQHTFLAAYRELVGSHKPIVVRPWLYTIAHNRCLSILRARRERPVAEVLEPATANLAADLALREELRALLADVGRLPELQRAALVLLELGDLSHAEIADVIGCRPGKVKSLVFMARSSLGTSRAARDTPCWEIREQLAIPNRRGPSRTAIRRHLHACAPCRGFRDDVRSQRGNFALLLPLLPSAGLRSSVLGAAFGGGGGGAGAALTSGALLGGNLAAKVIVATAVVGGSVGGAAATPPSDQTAYVASQAAAPSAVAATHQRIKFQPARAVRTSPEPAGRSPFVPPSSRPRHRPPDRPSARRGRSRSSPRDRA